jgi:hypothetical protein
MPDEHPPAGRPGQLETGLPHRGPADSRRPLDRERPSSTGGTREEPFDQLAPEDVIA